MFTVVSFVHFSKDWDSMVVIVSGKDTDVSPSHMKNAPAILVTVYTLSLYTTFSGTTMSPVYLGADHESSSEHVSSDSILNRSPL